MEFGEGERQAEFLVHDFVPWAAVTKAAAITPNVTQCVPSMLAKRLIAKQSIGFELPRRQELEARLSAVLEVIGGSIDLLKQSFSIERPSH